MVVNLPFIANKELYSQLFVETLKYLNLQTNMIRLLKVFLL